MTLLPLGQLFALEIRRRQLTIGLEHGDHLYSFQKRQAAAVAIVVAQAIHRILHQKLVLVQRHAGAEHRQRPASASVGSGLRHRVDVGLGPERLDQFDDGNVGQGE